MGNVLPFELTEEAFTGSVVAAMPHGTHAADQRVAIQKALVVSTDELATAIRIQDHLPVTLTLALRFLRGEIALQQVFHACWTAAGGSSKATPLPAWPALNSFNGHQASNAVQADGFALVEQILVHPRRSDYTTAVLVDLSPGAHSLEHVGLARDPAKLAETFRQRHISRTGYSLRQRWITAYLSMTPWQSTLPRLLKNHVPWLLGPARP